VSTPSAHQFLTLYTWFAVLALVGLMALIARFYERLSGERTYFYWFLVPGAAFGGAAARLSMLDRVTGDAWADACLLVGGVSLGVLCVHIYRRMTSGH
jgi:hypothetical protein